MFKKLIIVLTLSLPLLATSSLSADGDVDRKSNDVSFDEFDRPEQPYLLYKVTLGFTLEGYFPTTKESRREYVFGNGIGINVEFHLLYPISLGLNYRVSKVSLDNSYYGKLELRTVGATMRLFLDPRNNNSPYLRLGIGAGHIRPSTSNSFVSGEIGAGYMMRLGSHSWIRLESVYIGNSSTNAVVYAHPYPVELGDYTRRAPLSYDLNGLTLRVEAGFISW